MISSLLAIFKVKDLRKKILTVLFLLFVFRLLAAIPIPGVDADQLRQFFAGNQLLGFLNIFSGGGLSNLSIMMLGVGPYITATIIMQLLTMLFPSLKAMYYEEGEQGRAKFNRISRYLTIPLAGLQAYGFLNLLVNQGVLPALSGSDLLRNVIVITAGTIILMWIGELVSEQKIGNGISLIIFAGIVSRGPTALRSFFATYNPQNIPLYVAFLIMSVIVIAGIVFITQGERKIPISHAKRIRGNKMFGGSSSYLPLKVNQAGVIPIIFAISVLLFPQFIAQISAIFSKDLALKLNELVTYVLGNQIVYMMLYFFLVVLFTYFYTAVTFDPKEIAKNLQRSGGFIPGIRPGENSSSFLSKVTFRITLFGAIFLGLVAIMPNITRLATGIQILTIGGTALLIVIAVAIETMNQIESQLVLREYEGF